MKWKIEFVVADAQGLEQMLIAMTDLPGTLYGVAPFVDEPPPRTAAPQISNATVTTKPQSRNSGVGKGYRVNSVASSVQAIVDQFDKGYKFNFKEVEAILEGMGHPEGAKMAMRQKLYKLLNKGRLKKLDDGPGRFMKS